jgi:DNA invertase Pin-like site-specific DNA recombinase
MSRISPNKILRKPPFDSDKEEIERLIDDGWSDSRIAKFYSVTKDTIWCRRQRWGLVSGVEVKNKSYLEDITQLWVSGYTPNEIADVLKISLQMVYAKMRQYHIRDAPRMGVTATTMSASDVGRHISDSPFEDELILVTYKRQPRYALVPIDDYTDLIQIEKRYQHEQQPIC